MKKKSAFSLIELSMVIMVIGIVIAGVTQSASIIQSYHKMTAESITDGSSVASMPNLVLWFEAATDASFNQSQDLDDGDSISVWKDINPASAKKYTITQALSDSKPIYIANCFNNLPCLRFDGINDYFDFDGSFLVGTDYSIIVVEKRRSAIDKNYFLGGSNQGDLNSNLYLGYRDDTTFTFSQESGDVNDVVIDQYAANNAFINVATFAEATGKQYYRNGSLLLNVSGASAKYKLASYDGSRIGSYFAEEKYYDGDIFEIIIFNRKLKTTERRAIESYLSKKWKITVS